MNLYIKLICTRDTLVFMFDHQMAAEGLIDCMLFPLSFSQRERAVRDMLTLHCPLQETDESVRREHFLTERLLIPEQWIHEAKAIRARRNADKHQEALHLYRAGYWNKCHRLLIQHLASGHNTGFSYLLDLTFLRDVSCFYYYWCPLTDCIINDNHDYLLDFLEGLAVPENSATIQDWDTAGRVYLDYIRVIKTLGDIQQVLRCSLLRYSSI